MADEQQRKPIKVIPSPRTGRELVRVDEDTEKVRVRDRRGYVWLRIRDLLDRTRTE